MHYRTHLLLLQTINNKYMATHAAKPFSLSEYFLDLDTAPESCLTWQSRQALPIRINAQAKIYFSFLP